ncbi:hypothetical protein [Streptomyces sp. NPDC057617]|uniref:hypothetical protein n=1 Tax=Streptomyces sp. NPDC057617 TaxID=3346184 RepID=UPI0036793C23
MCGTRATGLVPYITAWSAERPLCVPPVTGRSGGRGIAYVDEHSIDRDEEGVL